MKPLRFITAGFLVALAFATTASGYAQARTGQRTDHPSHSFLASLAANPALSAGTNSAGGDANPYGVTVVPRGFPNGGSVHPGDILVSNFNNSAGKQGEGTTIVAVAPNGSKSTFFTASPSLGHVGLSTALVALRSGIVVVGNTPTLDGTSATVSNGSLIFLDGSGNVLLNLTDSALLQGPWDMTANDSNRDRPVLYVSNVLAGTVVRIELRIQHPSGHPSPQVQSITRVASGFLHRTDPNALVVGPTGLLLSRNGRSLFVADTGRDRITVVRGVNRGVDHGPGRTVAAGGPLEGPLGLAWSPLGTIITSNGDAAGPAQTPANINRVVELNPRDGRFLATRQLDASGTAGAIFGITIARFRGKESLIYVNDNTNSLDVLSRR